MSLKNLTHILVFLSLILLTISPPSAKAATLSGSDTDSSDGCTGSWTFPPLSVGGEDGVVFAQAAYEFDENCNPVSLRDYNGETESSNNLGEWAEEQ